MGQVRALPWGPDDKEGNEAAQLDAQKSRWDDAHRQGQMRGHCTETQVTSWEKGQEGQTRAAMTVILRQAQRHK